MPLAITQDHRELADVVRSFARGQGLREETRHSLEKPPQATDTGVVWQQVADLGWAGLHVAEEHGGSGYGLAELAVVVEALGSVVASGPLVATSVASAVIARVGTADQRARLLPRLTDGSTAASVGVGAPLQLGPAGLSGESLALGGTWAQLHLLPAGDDLVVVRADAVPGQVVAGGLDPSLGLTLLALDGVPVADGDVLVGGRSVARTVLRTLAAAEAAGGARACLDMALAYAKVREQFGRAIGSFQAIKHHLADMLVRSEQAVATAWDAARVETGQEAELAAAVAAVVSLDAYQHNARMNIQVHGGIGFTWEHDAHLYLRRAAALAAVTGSPDAAADDVRTLSTAGVRRDGAVALPPEAEAFRRDVRTFVAQY